MRTHLQDKLLQLLAAPSKDRGFSSWSLLGLLVLVGALGAIALPSFLGVGSSCGSTPQSEAKRSLGSINRAQIAYRLENQTFASTVKDLGLGIDTLTVKGVLFFTDSKPKAAFSYAIAEPTSKGLSTRRFNSYVGAVYITPQKKDGEAVMVEIICQTTSPEIQRPSLPIYEKGVLACGNGTTDINGPNPRKP
jgi:type IV pilus assembly protein PilA